MERLVECSKLKFSAAFDIQNKVAQTGEMGDLILV